MINITNLDNKTAVILMQILYDTPVSYYYNFIHFPKYGKEPVYLKHDQLGSLLCTPGFIRYLRPILRISEQFHEQQEKIKK